jgi:hypothetical protein
MVSGYTICQSQTHHAAAAAWCFARRSALGTAGGQRNCCITGDTGRCHACEPGDGSIDGRTEGASCQRTPRVAGCSGSWRRAPREPRGRGPGAVLHLCRARGLRCQAGRRQPQAVPHNRHAERPGHALGRGGAAHQCGGQRIAISSAAAVLRPLRSRLFWTTAAAPTCACSASRSATATRRCCPAVSGAALACTASALPPGSASPPP